MPISKDKSSVIAYTHNIHTSPPLVLMKKPTPRDTMYFQKFSLLLKDQCVMKEVKKKTKDFLKKMIVLL